ncbi:hypothetical protein B8W95_12900, partial [Staphylococcus pasteuri]
MRKSTDVSFTGWKKLEELEQAQKLEQRRATSKSARMGASSGRRVDWLRSVCTLGDSLRLLRRAVGALASVAASTIGRALALLPATRRFPRQLPGLRTLSRTDSERPGRTSTR